MEATQIYAIIAGSMFAILTIINLLLSILQKIHNCNMLILRHLIYPFFIRRHGLIGPWTRNGALWRFLYLITNLILSVFPLVSLRNVAERAGHICLINMVPLFFGPHLSFLADVLGVPLHTYHSFHGASAAMTVILGAIHVILGSLREPLYRKFTDRSQVAGLVGGITVLVAFLAANKHLRRFSYEIFLRGHQILATISICALWVHTTASTMLPRLYIYILLGSFGMMASLETALALYRNFALGQPSPRIRLARRDASVQVSLSVPRPWNVKAGQYVNLWIPSIRLWQSHPYTIVSWTESALIFLIEPHDGFSDALLSGAMAQEQGRGSQAIRRAFFTGPHGATMEMGRYGSILMFASGYGIAAQLPHIKQLIRGYNQCKVRTRRIHLVWQLKERGNETIAEDLLDEALCEDTSEEGYILRVSIYFSSGDHGSVPIFRGRHARVSLHGGRVDLRHVYFEEIEGVYNKCIDGRIEQRTGREWSNMLVAVSASNDIRDEIRRLVLTPSDTGRQVHFLELEFQPCEDRRFFRS